MKVLIAYDGSTQADNALADLSAAGLPASTEALILSVAEPWVQYFGTASDPVTGQFSSIAMGDVIAFDKHARHNAAIFAKRGERLLRSLFPRWKISAKSVVGSPAESILEKSESWKPDLIVIGSHGRSALGRMLLGSVSQKVLNHARASLRLTHGKPSRKARPPRILAAFDGSADGNRALEVIAARKWPKGTRVKLVAVFDYRVILENLGMSDGLEGRKRIRSLQTNWTEKQMAAAAKRLAAKGLRVEQQSMYGEARRALLREADAWRADCIFVGSRGLNTLERFFVGSVSSAVASHAKCTVEIVRQAKSARRGK